MTRPPARTLAALLPIPIAALIAVLPLLLRGPSCGHDFDFHLLSWLEAATQFAHLHYPRWAYTPAFNAGEPRFIFYPPLSWALGALLGMFLPWTLVPAAFIFTALTLSGLTFAKFARQYTGPASATLAAVLYLVNPYMLFTAYERSAFAELLAAAWLPMLLAAGLPRSNDDRATPSRRILRVAVPLALVWLTNAPAAVMFSYALAALTLLRLALPARNRSNSGLLIALTTAAGTLLGLALAAVYIIPAAYERRFVQIKMVVMEGMRVDDHFLFHRMAGHTADDLFHNAVVRSASFIVLGLLAAIALAAFAALRRRLALDAPPSPPLLRMLLLLAAIIAFLLTPASLSVWHHLPEIAFLQFPWRLGALLGALLAFLFALALPTRDRSSPPRFSSAPCVLAALLVLPAWFVFHQACDLEDSIPARVALYHSPAGTESTDEYTPTAADPDALQPHNPPYWLIPTQTPGSPAYAADAPADAPASRGLPPGQAPAHLELTLPYSAYVVLNRRSFPGWHAFSNHFEVTKRAVQRQDGLIALPIPAGTNTIDLKWQTPPDQAAGIVVTAAAVLLSGVLAYRVRRRRRLTPPLYSK